MIRPLSLKTEQFTKVNGTVRPKRKVLVYKSGQMDQYTLVNGLMVKRMARDNWYMPMVTSMLVSGSTTRPRVKDSTSTVMAPRTLATGMETCNMEMVRRPGLMGQDTKEPIPRVARMDLAPSIGLMDLLTKETSRTTKLMARVRTIGQMGELTQVLGRPTRCMGMAP